MPAPHVQTADEKFLAALAADGVPIHHPNAAVNKGRMICTVFDQGGTLAAVIADQFKFDAAHPQEAQNYTEQQLLWFYTDAIRVYCPHYEGHS
ncbi:DUF732 domain-containing protein [Mycobacterium paraintracellulare]|uniref:DUF732 domain-containing protein n=1 Tax=Mycobacterium paraintracellulare TaxID=1138383 RepID=UPI001F3BDE9A|nr:DUF732 domain-containing protein [Mycobacterium paraintracellulare]